MRWQAFFHRGNSATPTTRQATGPTEELAPELAALREETADVAVAVFCVRHPHGSVPLSLRCVSCVLVVQWAGDGSVGTALALLCSGDSRTTTASWCTG